MILDGYLSVCYPVVRAIIIPAEEFELVCLLLVYTGGGSVNCLTSFSTTSVGVRPLTASKICTKLEKLRRYCFSSCFSCTSSLMLRS